MWRRGEKVALQPGNTRIFAGGPILTMEGDPGTAEAVAISNGKILARGDLASVTARAGAGCPTVDLDGRTLMPGFVDGHGHITGVARALDEANLAAPPIGSVDSIPRLMDELRSFIDAQRVPARGWVVGRGYDPAFMAEERHPTRHDLDAVSVDHPILVRHVSGHLAAANTAALGAAGCDARTADPPGGVIRREPDGSPDGVLEESAMAVVASAMPPASPESDRRQLLAAQRLYAENGITTAQEGALFAAAAGMLERAASAGELEIDVVAYPFWAAAERVLEGREIGTYHSRLKYGGMKLMLDGSPQGKTAWLTRPYHAVPEGLPRDYCGYPAMDDERATAAAQLAFERGWQVICHCNGDAAADQFIGVIETIAGGVSAGGRRPVMIHAQTVREDQLDAMARLGILPSFFASHVHYWGDYHRDSVLGPERAARISPLASAARRGLRFNLHNDSPVTPPDIFRLIASAVTRRTSSGATLGPEQRVDVSRALRAVTIDAAYAHFEEDRKGSITPGKLADFVFVDRDPTAVAEEEIAGIRVLETIKEGRTVYRAD